MSGWTEEKTERLRALWATGASASAIAAIFGDCTRNSVISKVHRSGMPKRGGNVQKAKSTSALPLKPTRRYERQSVDVSRPSPPSLPILKTLVIEMKKTIANEDPPSEGIELLDLESWHCRFIISADGQPARFCGTPKIIGSSYCEPHNRLCHSGRYQAGVRPPKPEPMMKEKAA